MLSGIRLLAVIETRDIQEWNKGCCTFHWGPLPQVTLFRICHRQRKDVPV